MITARQLQPGPRETAWTACDWLVEADQDDQDDPLTVHRPARTLLSLHFIDSDLRRRESTAIERRIARDSSGA